MRIIEDSHHRLTLAVDDSGFSRVLKALSFLFLLWFAVMIIDGSYQQNEERLWGVLCGAVLFLAGGLAVAEQARFAFDASKRELAWQRARWISKQAGIVPFSDITDVICQSLGNPANPGRRIVLILRDGDLPLMTAYVPGKTDSYLSIQEKILALIGSRS